MKSRYFDLINYLLQHHDWLSTKVISNHFNISTRTVRAYISEINKLQPNLIESSNKGYRIDYKLALNILTTENTMKVPQNQEERILYIIRKLLTRTSVNDQISIYDLEDDLFVSTATITIDLQKVSRKLLDSDLSLVKKGDYLFIDGPEKNKRKVISTLIHAETERNFISQKKLQEIFPDYDITFVHKIVSDTLNKYQYFCNDYALFSLLLHIIISIDRVKHKYTSSEPVNIKLYDDYLIAKEISVPLEKEYDISFPDQEIYELSLLLRSRVSKHDYSKIDRSNLISEIGEDVYVLAETLISEVNDTYYVSLEDDDFLVKFALHISNLLIRCRNDYPSRNPLTSNLQQQYPLIFEIALFIATRIQELKGVLINADEVAYIALHIGGTLEAKKSVENKLTCLIYSPQYYDQNLLIFKKISDRLPILIVKDIVTDEHQINDYVGIDLVISTVDMGVQLNKPWVAVSPFINDNDLLRLNNLINTLAVEKRQKKLKVYLEEFINEDLFYINQSKEVTKEDSIKLITDIFSELGYTDDKYFDDVMRREELNPTVFGNIAIPHSLKMNALKTGIFIFISKNPIRWNDNKVELIMLLAINEHDRNNFKDIYENLTLFLSEAHNVEKVVKCKNYKEFIDTLVTVATWIPANT